MNPWPFFPAFRRTATMLHILATSISDRPNRTPFSDIAESFNPLHRHSARRLVFPFPLFT
jgi:hypothetical protein